MTLHRDTRQALAGAVALVALWTIGAALVGDPTPTDITIDPAVYAVEPPYTTPPAASTPRYTPLIADANTPAQRQTTWPDPTPPTTTPPPPTYTPGECSTFRAVFAWFGATDAETDFFVPRILDRETGCGRDLLNESTGDSGPCQLNPVHNTAGWFGRQEFGAGGWLLALHGLRTRHDLTNIEWINACLTLYRVCGPGPWAPPYSCDNRPLP